MRRSTARAQEPNGAPVANPINQDVSSRPADTGGFVDSRLCILLLLLGLVIGLFFHILTSPTRLELPSFVFSPPVVDAIDVVDSLKQFDPVEIVRQSQQPATPAPTLPPTTLRPTTLAPTTQPTEKPTKIKPQDIKDENAPDDVPEAVEDLTKLASVDVEVQLPDYTQEELVKRGFGKFLFVYRVVAENVAVRTKPSPIGSLAGTTGESVGLVHGPGYRRGDLVVGYQLSNAYGLWLKLAPYYWAPVSKKKGDVFVPVMRQVKLIPVPQYLKVYWAKKICVDGHINAECQDNNQIRAGVLLLLRRLRLMDERMDPDYVPATFSPTVKLGAASPLREEEVIGDDDHTGHAEDDQEQDGGDGEEDNDALVLPNEQENSLSIAANNEDVGVLQGDEKRERMHANCLTFKTEDQCPSQQHCVWASSQCMLECRHLRNWFLCVRQASCAWVHNPNQEYCDFDLADSTPAVQTPPELEHDPKYDFTVAKPGEKFFIYQPSGGWNNQRLLLENAMVVCMLLKRTCIVPPASPHSNYYRNYNQIPSTGVVSMSRVLNFEALNQVVRVRTPPKGHTLSSFLEQEVFPKHSVRTVIKDISKWQKGYLIKWGERDMVRLFGNVSAQFLYFANQTMWGTMEWKGAAMGRFEKRDVQMHTMPANHIKAMARRLAELMGPYHAVHIRRGDKVGEVNFKDVSHLPEWWASKIAQYKQKTSKVYIATDEAKRSFFDTFVEHGLEPVFFESLPEYETLVKPYLSHFPSRMNMDILGMVEQLLCTYANKFLGSGYSTFTTFILRMRKYRHVLGVDTSFDNPEDSIPEAVRDEKSTCNPLLATSHASPC